MVLMRENFNVYPSLLGVHVFFVWTRRTCEASVCANAGGGTRCSELFFAEHAVCTGHRNIRLSLLSFAPCFLSFVWQCRALTAVSTVAKTAEGKFGKYYDAFMPGIRAIVTTTAPQAGTDPQVRLCSNGC